MSLFTKKKIISVCLLILLIGIVLTFFWQKEQSHLNSTISERSKEFLKTQQAQAGGEWSGVNFKKDTSGTISKPEIKDVDNCFSIAIPFKIYDIHHNGPCFDQFFIDTPKGSITTYIRTVTTASLEEDSGVMMRIQNKDKYTSVKKIVNGKEYLIFHGNGDSYEGNAFYQRDHSMFVLNLISNTNANLDEYLFKMIETIKFNEDKL